MQVESISDISDKSLPIKKGVKTTDVIALKINNPNLTLSQAENILGICKQSIYYHLDKANVSWNGLVEDIRNFNTAEIDILTHKASMALESLTPEKLEKESAVQNSTVYCQLFDKRQLLLGRATAMIGIEALVENRLSLEDASKAALERKQALEAKIAALESANPTAASDTSQDE